MSTGDRRSNRPRLELLKIIQGITIFLKQQEISLIGVWVTGYAQNCSRDLSFLRITRDPAGWLMGKINNSSLPVILLWGLAMEQGGRLWIYGSQDHHWQGGFSDWSQCRCHFSYDEC